MMPLIPICFYPLRKIILDDDLDFSQSLLLKLSGQNFTSCNSPEELIRELSTYKPRLTKSDLIINHPLPANATTQHIVNIDLEKLAKLLSGHAFHDISVLLVDYHMPQMTGIDFLNQISHLPIKKALITGENDYKIAVDSFNSGLIDAYLRKDDPEFSSKIANVVSELEWKYFTELSNFIYDIPDFNFLKNANLLDVFKDYIEKHHITAFGLIDSMGSFITQNKHGEKKYLLIRNENQLAELAKIAEEDGASANVIEQLKHGKAIPFFNGKECWQIPAGEWRDYLFPATNITGEPGLFWATA